MDGSGKEVNSFQTSCFLGEDFVPEVHVRDDRAVLGAQCA